MIRGFKVFTHDLGPPVRGGNPVWDGKVLPHTLPRMVLSHAQTECEEGDTGWYACTDLSTAFRIAGLWPDGSPSRAFHVETDDAVCVSRGNKLRAETWTLTRECAEDEFKEAIIRLSAAFGPHKESMAESQIAWRLALGRPARDATAVEANLRVALRQRGLEWSLKRYDSARAAWAARDAWDARAAWATRAAWAAWDARGARDAWTARDALSVWYASRRRWVTHNPDLLTIGLRDAYTAGLGIALPTGPAELGWTMETTP